MSSYSEQYTALSGNDPTSMMCHVYGYTKEYVDYLEARLIAAEAPNIEHQDIARYYEQ